MGTIDVAAQDWSCLPEDLLLIVMASMEVPDVVRSGAVCSNWRSAYDTFRRFRLPTPKQPPCLLYACDAFGAGAAALYSPSTNATFRVPFPDPPLPLRGVAGSAHGWLFTTDEAANPYLLNPLTGAHAELPPVTTLKRVKGSFLDGDGNAMYSVDFTSHHRPVMQKVTAKRMRDWVYHRVAVSGSPFAAGGTCVVLLVHMPYWELSFARPGDERWTSLSNSTSHLRPRSFGVNGVSAVYSEKNGLFYVLQSRGIVHAVALNGPSPVSWPVSGPLGFYFRCAQKSQNTGYLVITPCGELLLVERSWHSSGRDSNVATTGICLKKIDVDRGVAERLPGVGDNALFLGLSSAVCLPVKDYPTLNANCAYLTDDSDQVVPPIQRQDLAIWDFESGSLHKLAHVWPLHPWLDLPVPIWMTPSLH